MKRTILFFTLLLTCLSPASLLSQGENQPTRAVSLKVLQEQLGACTPERSCHEELLELGGLTRIQGYILDDASNDLILFGQVGPESLPLHTEDFVVALRNAWLKYAELKGDTYYYFDPGCSIDPNPDVVRQLDNIGDRIFSQATSEAIQKEIEKWHAICEQPQNVRILGIPFNTRFAKTMVEADYNMKRLADGSQSLEIDSFMSLTDISLNRVKEDILNDRWISIPRSSMNRFWFHPGENKYKYDNGITLIDKCSVILLTEVQYLTRSNKIAGTGKRDPLAERFANDFTMYYSEIARQRPVYSELEGLFRFVALAKIMKYNRMENSINLNYFLEEVHISQVAVDRTLPGISHVKDFQHRWDYSDSYETLQLWLPSCGGVTIRIDVGPEDFVKKRGGELAKLRESIVKSRPSADALSWDVPQ